MAIKEAVALTVSETISGAGEEEAYFINFTTQKIEPDGEQSEPVDLGPRRGTRQGIRLVLGEGQLVDILADQTSPQTTDVFHRDEDTNKHSPGVEQVGRDFYKRSGSVTPDEDHSILFQSPNGAIQRVTVSLVPESKLKEAYQKRRKHSA